jgi:hypothetical protein
MFRLNRGYGVHIECVEVDFAHQALCHKIRHPHAIGIALRIWAQITYNNPFNPGGFGFLGHQWHMNSITAVEPEHAKIPVALKHDREAIEVAMTSVGLIPPEKLKVIRIKNTKHLGEVEISQAYEDELSKRNDLEIISEEKPIA